VAFATELVEVVDLFNEQQNAKLALRVGIDSGPVSSGLLGQRARIYDLWGEAVDLAHRVHASSNRAGIFVSNRVRDSLGAFHTFTEEGAVVGADGSEPVWSLQVSTRTTT
jgi:class 3 adenylate cyclase